MFSNVVYLNRSGSMVKSCTIPYNLSAPPVPILPEQQHGLDWRCSDSGVSMATKYCNGCKKEKDVTEFGVHKKNGDGCRSQCKNCESLAGRIYRALHPEKAKESVRKYQAENHEKVIGISRLWRKNNPDKNYQSIKNWQLANPEKILEYARVNGQNRRFLKESNGGRVTREEWESLLEDCENKCLCCGVTNVKLAMDHIMPLSRGGAHSIDNIQPLCKSCNSRKKNKHIDYRTAEMLNTRKAGVQ